MPDLKLYVSPGSCARVPTVALEEIGVPFDTEMVRLSTGQQKSPEFLKVNPKGKVPLLLIDGQPMSENVAILSWLNRTYPDANLLPTAASDQEACNQIGDLAFFSGTVHPVVTRIAMPMKFIPDAAQSFELVRPKGAADMQPVFGMINDRLANQDWWYGNTWSIVDAYLYWTWWRVGVVGFDQSPFPHLKDHADRILQRPSVARAMEREQANIEILKSEGLYHTPK